MTRGSPFVDDDHGVLCSSDTRDLAPYVEAGLVPPAFQEAGPRRLLAFDPADVTAAMITCGGLCPGLNDVIRSLTLTLRFTYGPRRVVGYRYGFGGLAHPDECPPLELAACNVTDVNAHGGTILASSRGPQDPVAMVDILALDGVSILFCIRGDGTQRSNRTTGPLDTVRGVVRRRRRGCSVLSRCVRTLAANARPDWRCPS